MIHCIRTSFLHNDTVYDAEMRRDAHGCLWYGDIISETGEILYNDVSLDTNTECALTHLETLWLEHWKHEVRVHDQRLEADKVTPSPEALRAFMDWALEPKPWQRGLVAQANRTNEED